MRRTACRDRRVVLLACAWAIVAAAASLPAQSAPLVVERQGDRLHLAAPRFHFLEGKPLERLHDGGTVAYVFSVTVAGAQGGGRFAHVQQRFAVSYDLWEEKFSVVLEGKSPRSVSHLTAPAAEAWCLDNLLPSVSALPAEKTFVVKLEGAVVPDEEPQPPEGLTLSSLIDMFSRKGAAAPPHWELLSAPVRLADLKDRRQ